MRRWFYWVPLLLAAGCSGLDEREGGVVALEVQVPSPATIEVGEQLQLSAKALNADGDSIAAQIIWRSADTTLAVDSVTGVITGVAPGTARVQAAAGSLTSSLLTLSVIAPADTLIIVGDSVLDTPVDPGVSAPLTVQLQSFSPAGPVTGRPVVYEIVAPSAGDAPVVALSGGVQIDTAVTASDGTVSTVTIGLVSGTVPPDSAIVEVRAQRTRGAVVPGSGQHFIIRFQ